MISWKTDFSIYDMLTVETGCAEEFPQEFPFGLRGRAVLLAKMWNGHLALQLLAQNKFLSRTRPQK